MPACKDILISDKCGDGHYWNVDECTRCSGNNYKPSGDSQFEPCLSCPAGEEPNEQFTGCKNCAAGVSSFSTID